MRGAHVHIVPKKQGLDFSGASDAVAFCGFLHRTLSQSLVFLMQFFVGTLDFVGHREGTTGTKGPQLSMLEGVVLAVVASEPPTKTS